MNATEQTEWTPELQRQAAAEGWDVFHTGRNTDHLYDLQKLDDPELVEEEEGIKVCIVWEDDVDVWVFVRDNPSDLHTAALEFLKAKSPAAHAQIMAWADGQEDA